MYNQRNRVKKKYSQTTINIPAVLLIIFLIFYCLGLFVFYGRPLLADENFYFRAIDQISQTATMTQDTRSKITQIPGYLFFLAVLRNLTGIHSITCTRFLNVGISICAILMFYLLAKKIDNGHRYVKTAQFFFLPILFPLFFVIYGDILSILLLLLAFYFLISHSHKLSGLFGFLSLLIRQSNVIWIVFFCLYLLIEKYHLSNNKKVIYSFLKDAWVYIASILFIMMLFVANGGYFA